MAVAANADRAVESEAIGLNNTTAIEADFETLCNHVVLKTSADVHIAFDRAANTTDFLLEDSVLERLCALVRVIGNTLRKAHRTSFDTGFRSGLPGTLAALDSHRAATADNAWISPCRMPNGLIQYTRSPDGKHSRERCAARHVPPPFHGHIQPPIFRGTLPIARRSTHRRSPGRIKEIVMS